MEDDRQWSAAGLRILGEELDPDEVGVVLGVEATRTHRKGQPRSSRQQGVWRDSLWYFQSPLDPDRDMADHVKWLLDSLEGRLDALRALSEKFRVDLFCGFSSGSGQGGFTLDAATLLRLGRLGVPLVLDLYPPAAEDEIEGAREPKAGHASHGEEE
jgi:Domain of unknown function (DUF4279)